MKIEIIACSPETGFSAHGEISDEKFDPCPFCGSDDIDCFNTHTPHYHAECNSCGAEGPRSDYDVPQATSRTELIGQHQTAFMQAHQRWNARVRVLRAPATRTRPAITMKIKSGK